MNNLRNFKIHSKLNCLLKNIHIFRQLMTQTFKRNVCKNKKRHKKYTKVLILFMDMTFTLLRKTQTGHINKLQKYQVAKFKKEKKKLLLIKMQISL